VLGDLYCRVSVETPVNLTARQQELLKEFDGLVREGGTRHSPREASWVDKIKGLFG
jgi:molecular chaperone DnaJ